MISVAQAKEQVLLHVPKVKTQLMPIDKALGWVLSKDVISPVDLPNFDNSAMDGYGISWADFERGIKTYKVDREIKAGDTLQFFLKEETACPIYTGALVPDGVDVIIPVEQTVLENELMTITSHVVKKGQHVRYRGEQIVKGALALTKGFTLNPSAIGYLAAMGIQNVEVNCKPKVAIITTGNELMPLGSTLQQGQIYESNAFTLKALLADMNIDSVSHFHVEDQYQETLNCFSNALKQYDLVISTGGVSVGKYDLVTDVVEQLGVEKCFYKVNQKPGKPIYFGMRNTTLFFGLPGNPAAVVTSFYHYVLPAINKWQQKSQPFLVQKYCELQHDVKVKGNRTKFLKAYYNFNEVEVLEGQGSHILGTLAHANCFVELPTEALELKKGTQVLIHLLPHG